MLDRRWTDAFRLQQCFLRSKGKALLLPRGQANKQLSLKSEPGLGVSGGMCSGWSGESGGEARKPPPSQAVFVNSARLLSPGVFDVPAALAIRACLQSALRDWGLWLR